MMRVVNRFFLKLILKELYMVSQDIQDLVTRIDALTAKVSVDEAAAVAKAVDAFNAQRAEDVAAVTDAVGRAENSVPAAGV